MSFGQTQVEESKQCMSMCSNSCDHCRRVGRVVPRPDNAKVSGLGGYGYRSPTNSPCGVWWYGWRGRRFKRLGICNQNLSFGRDILVVVV